MIIGVVIMITCNRSIAANYALHYGVSDQITGFAAHHLDNPPKSAYL